MRGTVRPGQGGWSRQEEVGDAEGGRGQTGFSESLSSSRLKGEDVSLPKASGTRKTQACFQKGTWLLIGEWRVLGVGAFFRTIQVNAVSRLCAGEELTLLVLES